MNSSELLATFRKHKEKSQFDFSKKIDCSRTRLSRIESGDLAINQFEMAKIYEYFPSFHVMLLQDQLALPVHKDQIFEWPSQDHYLSRVEATFGKFLDEELFQQLGNEMRLCFWKTLEMQQYQILFQTQGYPLEFLWRMVQWLLMHQKLQTKSELNQFCHKVLAANKELHTIRSISENLFKQFEMFLDSWSTYSVNHTVFWSKPRPENYLIEVAPKQEDIRKLCFYDPILAPFILKFMQELVLSHFNHQVSVLVVQEGEVWKMYVNLNMT